jgi:hypothetical protein
MFVSPLVFVSEHLIQPMRLPRSCSFVQKSGIMIDNEFFAASVAAKRAHFPGIRDSRFLPYLALLDRNCCHRILASLYWVQATLETIFGTAYNCRDHSCIQTFVTLFRAIRLRFTSALC